MQQHPNATQIKLKTHNKESAQNIFAQLAKFKSMPVDTEVIIIFRIEVLCCFHTLQTF